MKLHWSQIEKAKVFDSQNKTLVGHLRLAFIHPETGQFIAFLLGFTGLVAPVDIEKWGKAEIHIAQNGIVQPNELIRLKEFGSRHCLLNSKTVLSKSGRKLGKLTDFTLDTQTNQLLQIHVAKGFFVWSWAHRTYKYDQIDHISPKAIHLNIDPEATVPTKRAFRRRLSMRSI